MVKYKYIANDIRNKIINGTYVPNTPMPIEKELCAEYNVSKDTMKKALALLVEEGVIFRQSGKGTFVRSNLLNNEHSYIDSSLSGYVAQRAFDNNLVESEVTFLEVINPPQYIADNLQIDADTFVYHFERIRRLNGANDIIEESYVPIDIVLRLNREILQASFFDYVENKLHLKIKSAFKTIKVEKCDEYCAEILGLEVGDPLPITNETIYLSTGKAFCYTIVKYQYHKFNFVTTIHK